MNLPDNSDLLSIKPELLIQNHKEILQILKQYNIFNFIKENKRVS
jgi:hypothetical protein